MEYLWNRTEKLEGSENNGGSTISSCVEQFIGGISDILSLENILEATASILEDDEDENELEDVLLIQCGDKNPCSVDGDGDKCQSDSQTEKEPPENGQSEVSVSDHNLTEILADDVTVKDNHETAQDSSNLKPSEDTIAVHHLSSTQEEHEKIRNDSSEVRDDSSPQKPSPQTITSATSEDIDKGDHDLRLLSGPETSHKEEGPATESVLMEKEVPTTEFSKVPQIESKTPTAVLNHTSDLPQENILHDTTSPASGQQHEMADQMMDLRISQPELGEMSATVSPSPGGEDVEEGDTCNPLTDVSSTEQPEGESAKLQTGDFNLSPAPQMMETILEEEDSSSPLQTNSMTHVSPCESDPVHTEPEPEPEQEREPEPEASSSPVGLPTAPQDHSQDQQDSPASDEPEGGDTAPPAPAPALERADREAVSPEDSKGTPSTEQQSVSSTEPDSHSPEEPPGQAPTTTTTAATATTTLHQDEQPGDQPPAPAPQAPAPEPGVLPPASLHATPESPNSGLKAPDFAAVGQEVTSMEQKGKEASSADKPRTDALKVNREEQPSGQPIPGQYGKPQPIGEQRDKPVPEEDRSDKEEAELEFVEREDHEECGNDAQRENGAQSSQSTQSLGEIASTDGQPANKKYNTVCYRKIKKGNTKQRIDEFESMMSF
ncbi:proteoglycan 4-like [Alosa sapidissima]|uniref:proteoglycan 4-like n=1 Tax=Alosa sapidissima TaxID=34773 RepID=UPI001C091DB4|nr:proteoglycan 4-like [Alosa sapidissima]